MKRKKTDIHLQRQVLEKKLQPWKHVISDRRPPAGWIKAIRGSIGMTTKQLAERMGINQPGVMALEDRETRGSVTIDTLDRTAKAMNCKLVYAIVPHENYLSLEDLVNRQAELLAKTLIKKVSHSMNLEAQGVANDDKREQLTRLAQELKEKLDSRLWDKK